jgi:twinkle protein
MGCRMGPELVIAAAATAKDTRIRCPFCADHRHNKHERTCSVRIGDNGATLYNCWHCGEHGVVKSSRDTVVPMIPERPKPMPPQELRPLEQKHIDWLVKTRGLSADIPKRFGLVAGRQFFPRMSREADAIGCPYWTDGQLTAIKWVSIEEKAFVCTGAPTTFFMPAPTAPDPEAPAVAPQEALWLVEGEVDAMTLASVGVDAVSVPSGAPMRVQDGKVDPRDDKRFGFIWSCVDTLDKYKRIVIATDNDGPGKALAEEIARRVGKAKCWRLDWKDCKDANEFLLKHGADKLLVHLNQAEAWPIEGLDRASKHFTAVELLYREGLPQGTSTGWANVDQLFTLSPGTLVALTGVPGHGKSTFLDALLMNVAKERGWKSAIASFETPIPLHISKLASKYVGKPFGDGPTPKMDERELKAAAQFVDEHFLFLHSDGVMPTPDSLIDRYKRAVMQMGVRVCVADPCNYLSYGKGDEAPDTEAIGQMLAKLRVFAQAHDVVMFVVAHPAKPGPTMGKDWYPTGYSISGSAHWYNRPDVGLTVHRDMGVTKLHCWKQRHAHLGRTGSATLLYQAPTQSYVEDPTEFSM